MRKPSLLLGASAAVALALLSTSGTALAATGPVGSPTLVSINQVPLSDAHPAAVEPARDARAAAAASVAAPAASVAGVAGAVVAHPMATWYSGSVEAGASQSWTWNNANPLTAAYQVGFSPTGAATSAACQFEMTRSWYEQLASGERKFSFDMKNVGSVACATTVLLGQIDASTSWSTGGLNPGQTQSWTWNNANPLTASYVVGLSPTGATSSSNCRFEVTRTWYEQLASGERKFHFDVRNSGSIACVADVRLAWAGANSTFTTGSIGAGATAAWYWNNANPTTVAYAVGLKPAGASTSGSCQLQVTRNFYLQQINADGTTQRRLYVAVRNLGSAACSATVLLTNISA